jgi:hypothetical protein
VEATNGFVQARRQSKPIRWEIKSLCERTLAKTDWLAKKPPTHSG